METLTGFIASSFDVMHPGYALLLKECRDNCNYLVVGLHENPVWERQDKNSPIMSLHERFLVLKSIRYIDEIAPYKNESELLNLLKFYKPDIRFLGSDYKEASPLKITGYKLCKNIHYIDRFHDYSSSVIRKKIYEAEKYKEDIQEFIKEEVVL
jgi:cytidyltransferase-like protein|tara:strand:+ start:397 stop:858 length:462 start_codon:yes stop_codon:yes gene_type:complete